MTQLVVASSSPRRRALLASLGLRFRIEPADVDESVRPSEPPVAYVTRIARAKALVVATRLGMGAVGDVVVLAADTTVVAGDEILGKPVDDDDARRMLGVLSGSTHRVHTAVVGWRITGTREVIVTTDVTFVRLTDADVEWYLGLGEHRDKAGAYGMQGAAAAFVERIDGSPTNVIGLPLTETIGVLRACGVPVPGP